MSNSITKAKEYAAALDKAYAAAAVTSVLNASPDGVRPGIAAGSFLIAKTAMTGLGTYNRATGGPAGDVTLTWEEHTYACDRGRKFVVDAMDDLETAGQAFGTLAAEFLRTKVVPEIDAYRLAAVAASAGTVNATGGAALAASGWVPAIDTAKNTLVNYEVDYGNLILFISAEGATAISRDTTVGTRFIAPGQNPDSRFGSFDGIPVAVVPSGRFYTGVTLDAGSTSSAGGFTKNGKAINFLLMDKTAVFCDVKHQAPRIFSPSVNQTTDGWLFDYRVYHDAFVLENKTKGIYLHQYTS